MVSGSDRHASRWREALRIPGVENLTLDQAYKAMRWLGEDIAGSGSGTEGRHTTDVNGRALAPIWCLAGCGRAPVVAMLSPHCWLNAALTSTSSGRSISPFFTG